MIDFVTETPKHESTTQDSEAKPHETTAIQVLVKPVASVGEVLDAWKQFEFLKQGLLDKTDVVEVQGKRWITRSGWRKIGVAFGLSYELVEGSREDRDDKSFKWTMRVKAVAPSGRSAFGVAVCDSRERNFAHIEHDVYATAYTRACNRAISDLVGGGAVSYEEIEYEDEAKRIASARDVTAKQVPETQAVALEQPPKSEARHVVRWTVKGEDMPIPLGERPYETLMKGRVMKGLSEKHGIRFEEEVVGGHIVALLTSDMPDVCYDEFEGALNWSLRTIFRCNKNEVKVWVE